MDSVGIEAKECAGDRWRPSVGFVHAATSERKLFGTAVARPLIGPIVAIPRDRLIVGQGIAHGLPKGAFFVLAIEFAFFPEQVSTMGVDIAELPRFGIVPRRKDLAD